MVLKLRADPEGHGKAGVEKGHREVQAAADTEPSCGSVTVASATEDFVWGAFQWIQRLFCVSWGVFASLCFVTVFLIFYAVWFVGLRLGCPDDVLVLCRCCAGSCPVVLCFALQSLV